MNKSLGRTGYVLSALSPEGLPPAEAGWGLGNLYAVGIDADGKIVAAGRGDYRDPYTAWGFYAVVRYNDDGTPDDTFGSKGVATTPIRVWADAAYTLAIQPDTDADGNPIENIIIAGSADGYSTGGNDIVVARLKPDGTLDSTFGGNLPQPAFSIRGRVGNEGNSGGLDNLVFTVTRSGDPYDEVSVEYYTSDGLAKVSDGDYVAANGTLKFARGELSKTITVQVFGDTKYEPDENFYVNLTNARNLETDPWQPNNSDPLNPWATIADGQGSGLLVNDDAKPKGKGGSSASLADAALVDLLTTGSTPQADLPAPAAPVLAAQPSETPRSDVLRQTGPVYADRLLAAWPNTTESAGTKRTVRHLADARAWNRADVDHALAEVSTDNLKTDLALADLPSL